MTQKPNISIIMASYNHADFIGEAINSIQQQDYEAWELLIADDASSDQTLDVLSSYTNDSRIKVFPFKINRQYHMRNFAAKHACGDYIALLNSDDIFYPGKLSKQVECLKKNSHLTAVFTHVKCIDQNNKRLNGHALEKIFAAENKTRQQWLRHFFMFGNQLCISSAMIRRDCFEKIGEFNPLLVQLADLDLWIKICLKEEIHVITELLTGMRILKKNLSTLNPTSMSRLFVESQQVYTHYFSTDAIQQIPKIFPELMDSLPEDIPQWRYYLLCRTAINLPYKPMRLLGFTKLHTLLKNEETRLHLQKNNPHLLHTLFLSEGTAALDGNCPEIKWTIFFPASDGSYHIKQCLSYSTGAAGSSTICFSFPNPQISGRLCLTLKGRSIPFKCRQFRLYNQQTGELIVTSNSSRQPCKFIDYPYYHLPKIDFTALTSKWIDIEIERTPIKFGPFRHNVRKKLAGFFRKFSRKRCIPHP